MKRLVLFVMLFSVVVCGFSQNEETKVKTFEVGLDVFDLALLRTVDISFEYIKNPFWGFGLAARSCFNSDEGNGLATGERYSITPFFRCYFFNKQDYGSKGFYAETFLKFFGGDVRDGWFGTGNKVDTYFDAAFGVGLGYKYVNNSGFIVDLNLGLGRSFGLSDVKGDTGVGRGGITFGYRF